MRVKATNIEKNGKINGKIIVEIDLSRHGLTEKQKKSIEESMRSIIEAFLPILLMLVEKIKNSEVPPKAEIKMMLKIIKNLELYCRPVEALFFRKNSII